MALGTPYADSPTTFASAGTSAVPYPTGTVPSAGDFLLLTISLFVSGTVTTPAGWTVIDGFSNTGNTLAPTVYAFWKIAAGGESGTVTVTHSTAKSEAQIAGQSGADQTTPIDVAPVNFTSGSVDQSAGGSANCVITSITVATAGATVYTVSSSNAAAQTATPPSGFTEIADGSGANVNLHVSYKTGFSTGATGTETVVWSGTGKQCGFLVVVRPAALVGATVTHTRTVTSGIGLGISAAPVHTRTVTSAISGATGAAGADVGGLSSTQLEVKLNGVWTDITAYARLTNGNGITRTVGRSNEVDDSQPGSLTFGLDNVDGRFYPDSPTIRTGPGATAANPYYPYFVEDAQVRWHVNDGTSRLRFLGWITAIDPTFDGLRPESSFVTVTATDTLGRMSRGTLLSMLSQEQLASNPLACYPISEPTGAQQASDVSGNGMPALVTRVYGGAPGLSYGNPGPGVDGNLAATFGPPAATTGYGKFLISVGGAAGTLTGLGYSIEAWVRLDPAGAGQYDIVNAASADRSYEVAIQTTAAGVAGNNALAVLIAAPGVSFVGSASPAIGDGQWHHVAACYDQGTNFNSSYLDGVAWENVSSGIAVGDYRDLRVGGGIYGANIFYGSIAGVACYNRPLSSSEVLAHAGGGLTIPTVTIASQASSVCSYGGFSPAFESGYGPQNATPFKTLGLTPLDALLTNVRSEGGLVYDNGSGAYFRARSALHSGTVALNVDVEADLNGAPALSRSTINKVGFATAESIAGSQTVKDATAVALVGQAANVTLETSLASLVEIYSIASNRLALGVNRQTRISQIALDLLTAKNNLYATALTLQPGDRVRLSNLPSEFMGRTYLDGYVLGWSENLSFDGYVFIYDLVPADAPRESVFDTFRFASDGTSTGGTMTATATTMVITSPGATWSQNNADYPMDIDYNGERVTLNTAPGVGPSPQTFTGVTRGIAPTVARAHTSGEPVEVWDAIRFSF